MIKRTLGFTLFLLICLNLPLSVTAEIITIPDPVPPTSAVRDAFDLDPFYQQWIDVEGLPIVASTTVNPYALKEAAWLICQMIGHHPDVLRAMAQNNVRFAVMAYDEMTTDIPEHSDLRPDFYWDRRARGLGSTPGRPAVSCGEENLLNYPGDPYRNENILIHEFAHAIHLTGLNTTDPSFDGRLKMAYQSAMRNGLWAGTYAASNKQEYWAVGVQAWFHMHRQNDAEINHVNTRTELKDYDAALASLIGEVFGDTDWRYTRAITRLDLPHLQGFDWQGSPRFVWPVELFEEQAALTDPDGDSKGKWVDLKRHDPSELSGLRSRDGTATEILFVNNSLVDIWIYRLNNSGSQIFNRSVAAGRFTLIETLAGHIWLVKDANGADLAVFQAEERTGRAYFGKPQSQPQRLIQVSGNNQHGLANTRLYNPFAVEVRDQYDNPLPDVQVTFSVTAGGGMLSVTSTTTDGKGRAQSFLTLGSNPGTNTVKVSVEGISQTVVFRAEATPPLPIPTTLDYISGNNQSGLISEVLALPFVVEVRDQYGAPMEGITVTFVVSVGGSSLSDTSADSDVNGLARSTLTLGNDPITNIVEASVEGIAETVIFHAVAELLEFDLVLPSGINLIHVPLRVTEVDGIAQTIESVSDLYDALGGTSTVNFLITYDTISQEWYSYFVPSDRGGPADSGLGDDTGIIVGLRKPVSVHLRGTALGTDGNSSINLSPGPQRCRAAVERFKNNPC